MRRASIGRTPVLLVAALALVLAAASPVAGAGAGTAGTAGTAANGSAKGSATQYRLVDLGTLGGHISYATAMNDRGAVVGGSTLADDFTFHGFLWRNGKMTDLGLFRPISINNKGQIVGTRDDRNGAFLWRGGKLIDLGSLGGASSFPTAINDRGDVVGMSDTADGRSVPFLWSKGRMRELPLSSVSDINNRRQVAGGRVHGTGGFHATVWYRGKITDLGAGPFDRSNTYGINERGWVIGWKFSTDQFERGTLWRQRSTGSTGSTATATDVGTLGGAYTQLKSINDRGQILGVSQAPDGNEHPVLWWRGVLTDLTTLGVGASDHIADLNNSGQIASTISPEFGVSRAVVYR
jgi:probable HAF family extracellular repeat protein